jgi:ABC-type amino acid transport system permease subunit
LDHVTVLFAVLSTLTGIVIGLTCNVFALLTITILAALATALGAVSDGLPLAATLSSAVVGWACLQGGYMIGLTARDISSQIVARFTKMQSRRV